MAHLGLAKCLRVLCWQHWAPAGGGAGLQHPLVSHGIKALTAIMTTHFKPRVLSLSRTVKSCKEQSALECGLSTLQTGQNKLPQVGRQQKELRADELFVTFAGCGDLISCCLCRTSKNWLANAGDLSNQPRQAAQPVLDGC